MSRLLSFFFLSVVAFCLGVFLIFGAHQAFSSQTFPKRDALVITTPVEPGNLLPIFASDSASQEIVSKIFNGLLRYNAKAELEGCLAESWSVSEDGLTLRFKIREGVVWQDGASFGLDDVLFTLRCLQNPDYPTPYGSDFMKVESARAVDGRTIEIRYREVLSPAFASWTMPILPKHLLEKEDLLKTDFSRKPVGTGPFRLDIWKSGEKLELTAHDRYFEGRPGIARIIYRILPDPVTAFFELHTQETDLLSLTPLQYAKLADHPAIHRNYQKYRYPSMGYLYLGFNLKNELFTDIRVRRAMSHAVDRNRLIELVLLGLGRPATGPFLPDSWAHDPALKTPAYDPETSRRLLEEAGWHDGDGDGVREKDGHKFEFTLTTNHGNTQRQQTAEILQKAFADIGIKADLQIVEWSAFLKEYLDKKKFDAALLAWGLSPEPDVYDIWHSSKTREGEFNVISYANPEVDALLEEARRTFDLKRRQVCYRRIHRILYDEEPYLFLYVPDATPILHRRVEGVRSTVLGIGYRFFEWHVPEGNRRYPRFEA